MLRGPGIGDDCRGLAVLLAVARTMVKSNMQGSPARSPFVGNVGEEGLGDLRGVKHLFNEGMKGQVDRFVSIDGTGLGITNVARRQPSLPRHVQGAGRPQLRRVRVGRTRFTRSDARWRRSRTSKCRAIRRPRSTSARIGGGTSVNSIPSSRGWKLTCARQTPRRSRPSTPSSTGP